MRECPHPGCGGTVTPGGYCRRSGEPVDFASGSHAPRPHPGTWRSTPVHPEVTPPPGDVTDPLVLPRVTLPAPEDLSEGLPADDPIAGALEDGMLAGQYRVLRKAGYGGFGGVYLAQDTQLEDRLVAIKVMHVDRRDLLRIELKELVALNHPDIIRLFSKAEHPTVGEFLVLEPAEGVNLEEIRELAETSPQTFGGERFREYVLSYGIRILGALHYLHTDDRDRPKVYGDLKPQNVMHCGDGIKIVDLGSVRGVGEPGPRTSGYCPVDVEDDDGRSVPQDDLYGLGVTLHRLLEGAPPAPGLGEMSLRLVLDRATQADRRKRFADAAEMAVQLRGVLRELRSLRTDTETFEPSPLFVQSADALDGGLGAPPALTRWAAGGAVPRLSAAPSPGEVARGLPVPRPGRDANRAELKRLTGDEPGSLLQRLRALPSSPELHLLRCRLHLTLAVGRGDPGERAAAAEELQQARAQLGDRAWHDWRVAWHEGLLALADGGVDAAAAHFGKVYADIPGEYAPKLALGYCAEHRGDWAGAEEFYDAVRMRNHSLGSAVFGYARAKLAQGGTDNLDQAVLALERVPAHSRHFTAARTAVFRIRVRHARSDEAWSDAVQLFDGLVTKLGLTDERSIRLLETELWEKALDDGLPDRRLAVLARRRSVVLDVPEDRGALRSRLSELYRDLAGRAARSDLPGAAAIAERLIDQANSVRPLGTRHDRSGSWWETFREWRTGVRTGMRRAEEPREPGPAEARPEETRPATPLEETRPEEERWQETRAEETRPSPLS